MGKESTVRKMVKGTKNNKNLILFMMLRMIIAIIIVTYNASRKV